MTSLRKDDWRTLGGIEIPKIAGPDESGKPPYTRGIHDSMYRSRLWTMRQYAGFSSAEDTNERFKLLLDVDRKDSLLHLTCQRNLA